MNESLKDVWKNPEIIDWLDRGPLHETRHSLSAICPMITQSLKQNPKYRILDVACGPGSALKRMLYKKVPVTPNRYLGVDYSPRALELAKKHFPKYTFKMLNVVEDKLPPFEIVTCMDILQHLENPMTLMENVYQATKKICFINTWAKIGGEDWNRHHIAPAMSGKFRCLHRVFDLEKLEKGLLKFNWKLVYSNITVSNEWAGILVK